MPHEAGRITRPRPEGPLRWPFKIASTTAPDERKRPVQPFGVTELASGARAAIYRRSLSDIPARTSLVPPSIESASVSSAEPDLVVSSWSGIEWLGGKGFVVYVDPYSNNTNPRQLPRGQ